MYSKILDTLKALSVIVFFTVLSYEVLDLTRFSKTIIADTQRQSLQQITDLRKDTFAYLGDTTNKLNARMGSVQRDILTRVDINASRIDNHLTVAISDVNTHLNKLDTIVDVYTKLPEKINHQLTTKFGTQTDCVINELCWQNMTTDLLIDSRNVVRDGSKTFRLIDSNIPTLMGNVNTVSATVAGTFPPIALSIQHTADHIQKITQPHWYDKILTYGISGGLLYLNAAK
jgi:hypothetical protein